MPTYEYKCDACGHAFELFHSMSAAPVRKCPACKKLKVKRLIGTGAGLIFKGSGFYITDYRDQGYKDKAKAESGEGAKTDTAAAGGAAADGKGTAGGADGGGKKAAEPSAAPSADAKSGAASASASAPPKAPAAPKAAEPASASKSASKKGR